MNYEYKTIEIKPDMWTGKPKEGLDVVLNRYAREGWRLVQVMGPVVGSASLYTVILERGR